MIAAASLTALLQAATATPAAVQAVQAPPSATWQSLPMLPYRATPVLTPDMMRFARTEVEAGRCPAARRVGTTVQVRVELLVLTMPGNRVRRVTPVAIRCPAIEQYAAGLVTGLARDNLDAASPGGGWYRTGVTFAWTP